MQHSPEQWYLARKASLRTSIDSLNNKHRLYGWLRFLFAASAFLLLWLLWGYGLIIAIPTFIVLMGCFLFLVNIDIKNDQQIKHYQLLLELNAGEQFILDHQYTSRADGHELQPHVHDYALDLDIFGHASLYQYCNRTESEQGNQLFGSWLLSPAPVDVIPQRQQAVREMAQLPEWRQHLQAHGITNRITLKTEQRIDTWLQQHDSFSRPHWKVLQLLLPTLGIATLGIYIAGIIPSAIFYGILFIFFIVSFYISKLVMPAYKQLNRIAAEIETLSSSVAHIESSSFQSTLLQQLRKEFEPGHEKASHILKQLRKILDRLDYRLNPIVFIPLNTILFWDLHQAMALEKWKQQHRAHPRGWIAALAQLECISSLSSLHFNHPDWVFPVITTNPKVLVSDNLGHPLIPPAKRITSSFATNGGGQLNLVTGSNMAGKSTFLRSVGVNIVLAMAGAPVCATRFEVSWMKVMSSMRISDNLEESTSTFYAELKKLKHIIESVNRHEKIFLLLDEILRGTNSADRHAGSSALVKQLITQDAAGLLATHDLELAKLENDFPGRIHNYHFDVQVEGEELYFDYKLKTGVCRSLNASLLMKKIGIDV